MAEGGKIYQEFDQYIIPPPGRTGNGRSRNTRSFIKV